MTPKAFCDALEKMGVSRQKDASAFLKVSQSRVSDYKSGKRDVPDYIEASVQAHLLLNNEQLTTLKQLRGIN